jgi:H/ACA ribonucleoprotein complex subunit 3
MTEYIFKCDSCKKYTLEEICPYCNKKVHKPLPAKFTSEDKYGSYRRKAKKEELEKKGLY